jgi:hypothetical protein
MEQKLNKIEEKIDALNEHLSSIDVTLAKQEVSLAEHIRRSNALEEKLKPVERHVYMVHGSLKFLGLLSLSLGIMLSILKAVGKL